MAKCVFIQAALNFLLIEENVNVEMSAVGVKVHENTSTMISRL
jgi:hypothetical protein